MTVPQSTTTAESSLGREALQIARYYLGKRWVLVALGGGAVIFGLFFGGWAWLVAAGLAPIILATLPCLIMCGLGVCMMCRGSGEKQTTASRDAADATTSSAAIGVTKLRGPLADTSCCHQQASEAKSPQVEQLQPISERRDHA